MALELFSDFMANSPDKSQTQHALMCIKGIGDQHVYVLEADPTTGGLPITFSGTQDFGASNAGLRVAALLGNTTGIAAFGSGAVDAQTLRVSLATEANAAATPLSVRLSDGGSFYSFQFGSGVNTVSTLRNTPATDAPHLLNTRHEAATTPLSVRISDGSAFIADSNATVSADGVILGTALTASYQTFKTLTSNAVIASFRNTTDQNVTISVDGGVTASILLDPGESITLDFTSAKKRLATGSVIQVKHDGTAATYGRVKCLAIY